MSCWRATDHPSAEIRLTENDGKSFYLAGETLSGKLELHTNQSILIKDIDTETFDALHPSFAFTFTIPDGLPPSTDGSPCQVDGHINYYLSLEYIRLKKEPKEIRSLPIHVFPRVPPSENRTNIESIGTNKHGLCIRIKMDPGYVLSDKPQLRLEINIENPKRENIKEIKYQFVQKCEPGLGKNRTELLDSTIAGISNCTEMQFHRNVVLPISNSVLALPPTYNYSVESNAKRSIHIFYTLKIECCVEGFFKNIKFKIPIFVANQH